MGKEANKDVAAGQIQSLPDPAESTGMYVASQICCHWRQGNWASVLSCQSVPGERSHLPGEQVAELPMHF